MTAERSLGLVRNKNKLENRHHLLKMKDNSLPEAQDAIETNRNPFTNLEAFKVGQDFNEFETAIDYSVIPLRKPGKQQWFRVHPELKVDNLCFLEVEQDEGTPENFLLSGHIASQLRELPGISKRSIRVCVCRPNNTPFVWAIKMPKGSGTKLGAYKCFTSTASWEEPSWPNLDMSGMLKRSVGEQHIIASVDHPVVRQLQGIE